MHNNNDQNEKKIDDHKYLSIGISLGLCMGAGLGLLFDNIAT